MPQYLLGTLATSRARSTYCGNPINLLTTYSALNATIAVGNMLYSYGIDVSNKKVEECYYDTTQEYNSYGGASVGYAALHASTVLGTSVSNWNVLQTSGTGMETWIDANDGTYFFVYGGNEPEVFYKPKNASILRLGTVGVSGVVGLRILEDNREVHLVMSDAQGQLSIKSTSLELLKNPVSWEKLKTKTLTVPSGLGVLTIYPESRMYQTAQPTTLNFGINGYALQGTVHHTRIEVAK